jgi:hypothetical protein
MAGSSSKKAFLHSDLVARLKSTHIRVVKMKELAGV